ncbi:MULTISPECIES: SRPBCC family protein [Mycolicibacterium]|uniref:Cyclase n=1 Tax=Mycolicibacterium poriferae TaxID=39694 RepID=A0A6N4VE90_9MYCO|nr:MULTISPECIES: SRPBCC family protein [Mycolicibacterium]MCG7581999.1 SRPBCC family protein [Mycolicibacterium sp. OfavD-34-C]MCV7264672.1 SRPBCC family protein [Mycolicibacterium poriferae]QFS92137.1 Polyketide cyclase / dehydrase and lipid transport [Mycobacterium sp. THAF192]BBX52408.1 cyclase [Mycolicibacterium poriferae]
MRGAVTVTMTASAEQIWEVITDIRNIGRYSPETFEAEWLDGATGPTLGAKFRGHVRRNEIGPVYWTTCRVTACEPGREFGFEVLVGDRAVNNWHYRLTPAQGRTDVTESFQLNASPLMSLYSVFGGQLRRRRNLRDMRKTLERIKAVVEA